MQLAHARDDQLPGVLVGVHDEGRVLLGQLLERLVQFFIKVLLQSPGTFSNLGGGLQRALGSSQSPQALTSDLHLAVSRARQQIIAQQTASPAMPLDEQLQDAKLLNSQYNRAKLSLVGTVRVENRLNKSSVVGLGL